MLDSYAAFSPELASIGGRFFEKPWIDAALRPGKASGRLRPSDGAARTPTCC